MILSFFVLAGGVINLIAAYGRESYARRVWFSEHLVGLREREMSELNGVFVGDGLGICAYSENSERKGNGGVLLCFPLLCFAFLCFPLLCGTSAYSRTIRTINV